MYKLAMIDKTTHVTTYYYVDFKTDRLAHDTANRLAKIPLFNNRRFTVVEQYGH